MRSIETPSPPRRSSFAAAALLLAAAGCAASGAGPSLVGPALSRAAPRPEENEQRFGVRIEAVRLTAAGHLLDLRYRVTDPERAAAIVNRHLEPRLVVTATGRRLSPPSTPKAGALRQAPSTLEKGRVYFALFGNADGQVEAGDTVRVVLGALEQDVAVE